MSVSHEPVSISQPRSVSQLAAQLEDLASVVPEALQRDHAARSRLLRAIQALIPTLETPQDTAQRLLYTPCELAGAKIGADLGIFEKLSSASSPLETSNLAVATGCEPGLLARLLKYMASIGLVKEVSTDLWRACSITTTLAIPGIAAGINHKFDNVCPAWMALPDWLKSKNYHLDGSKLDTAFCHGQGEPLFPWLQKHPENARNFNLFMTAHRTGHKFFLDHFDLRSELTNSGILESDARKTLVDIGGGIGHVCAEVMSRFPEFKNRLVLQDLPSVIAKAIPTVGVKVMPVDFFQGQPIGGASAYYLRSILRDWSDDACRTILAHITDAMADHSVVLIDEVVVPNEKADKLEMQLDMTMLAMLNAEARTESKWQSLLKSVGLRIDKIVYYEEADREGVIVARKQDIYVDSLRESTRSGDVQAEESRCSMTNGEHDPLASDRGQGLSTARDTAKLPPTPPGVLTPLTSEDLNDLNGCVFDWADSYDKKDWRRLTRIITPMLRIDYRGIGLSHWPSMPAADYIAMCSAPDFLGDPTVKCQHLVGATFFRKTSETEAEGRHQIRAAHQVYTDKTCKTVKLKGHAHASNLHWYQKIDGVWKLAGLRPEVLWVEDDFDNVWKAARKPKELTARL